MMGYAQVFMMAEGIGAGLFNGVAFDESSVSDRNFRQCHPHSARDCVYWFLRCAEIGVWWTLNISDFFKGSMLALCALILLPRLERWHRFDLSRKEKALQQPSLR
ncbi:MAG: hypothetical protein MZU97_16515 [Bacillus subtilis]|nr:hypothetical protein [Bacillus subtilis]